VSLFYPYVGHSQDQPSCDSSDTIVHYCNIDDPGFEPNELGQGFPGGTAKFGPDSSDAGQGGAAQRFTAGAAGNVSSVTLGLTRAGTPGGKLIVSIWDVDDDTGYPGTMVGLFGEIDINSLTTRPSSPKAPLDLVTLQGSVTGLTPGTDYFLVVDNDDFADVVGRSKGWAAEGLECPRICPQWPFSPAAAGNDHLAR